MNTFRNALQTTGVGILGVGMLLLTGCAGFFVDPDSSSTSTSSNIVYVANGSAETVAAYQIGTETLTAVSGSPFSLGYVPQAIVVSRANSYTWVSSSTGVYGYSIASDGALTSLGAVTSYDLLSMDVSPDGQWLVGLDATDQFLDVFQIDTSTGALTLVAQKAYTFSNGTVTPKMVRFAPSGGYVFAALGSAGDVVFTFTTSTGDATQSQTLSLNSSTTSDNAVAVNSASTALYVARSGTTNGVGVYTIGTAGLLTPVSGSPFAAGSTPYAVTVDPTGAYVYVANRGDGTITGYLIGTTTALTVLGSSPYVSGSLVQSLVTDKSKTYLLAGGNGGYPDLTMYSFDGTTAGKLDTVASVTSATGSGVVAIAATH